VSPVVGPVERAITLETGSTDRFANMEAFHRGGVRLLMHAIEAAQINFPSLGRASARTRNPASVKALDFRVYGRRPAPEMTGVGEASR